MAASLLALLSQQTPNLPTRKGLILTGLQHDFLSPNGKLPVDNLESGFLERTKALIDQFRGNGEIIWIRTEIDASKHPSDVDEDACNVITSLDQHDEPASEDDSEENTSESEIEQPSRKRKSTKDSPSPTVTQGSSKRTHRKSSISDEASSPGASIPVDEEHFLTRTAEREACFIKGTIGADFAAEVKSSVQPTDLQVTKSYYSAFSSTSLLSTLRMKLITELYVCGAMTNLNVYATSMDAARYGIKITLVEDCLGYRQKDRHDLAIKRLVDIMDANVATSEEVIATVGNQPAVRQKVTEAEATHDTLGANVDIAADVLEVASSDEEDDEDLLSVRASPYKSHRALEIRGSRPQDSDLQAVKTGPEPHSQLQRHASTEPDTGSGTSQRETEDDFERPGEIEAVELEVAHPLEQPSVPDHEMKAAVKYPDPAESAEPDLCDQTTSTKSDPIHVQSPPIRDLEQKQQQCRNTCSKARRREQKVHGSSVVQRQTEQPLFGVGKEEESSGSSIQYDLLPPDRVDGLFQRLKDEVTWQKMHHQTGEVPRLVCCQGTIGPNGDMPIYRHPSDETMALLPWTPAVDEIRQAAEALVGHALNHALIQLYRVRTDFISEHSDKTLDISPGSIIVNASFGAERIMRLRTKRGAKQSAPLATEPAAQEAQNRTIHRVRLAHNSALLMSLATNAQYLHAINADKRSAAELTPAEKAYDGQRISLTFRKIGTFLDAKSEHIWGRGAMGKERDDAQQVVSGNVEEVEKLVKGFGAENAAAEIKWAEWYGDGSNVLHLK